MKSGARVLALATMLVLLAACSMVRPAATPLGTEQNPVKLAFSPSADIPKVLATGAPLTRLLERETGLRFKISVPSSNLAAIEALGTTNLDIAWLSPIGYVLAHDRVGATPLLANVREGAATTIGQIVVRADSGITTLEGLRGKRVAFVEPESDFGYFYPAALLAQRGVDPKTALSDLIFVSSHENAIVAVYNRQASAGATFGERVPGSLTDARAIVEVMLPDVFAAVRVLAQTEPIPNDTLVVRPNLPPDLVAQIRAALVRVAASEAGTQALRELGRIDGLAPVEDRDFERVRASLRALGLDAEQVLAGGRRTP